MTWQLNIAPPKEKELHYQDDLQYQLQVLKVFLGKGEFIIAFAPISPATIAVALLPSPRAGGTANFTLASRAKGLILALSHTFCAALKTKFSGLLLNDYHQYSPLLNQIDLRLHLFL